MCLCACIREQEEGRQGLKIYLFFMLQCYHNKPRLGWDGFLWCQALYKPEVKQKSPLQTPLLFSDRCNRWMKWKCGSVEGWDNYRRLPLPSSTMGTAILLVTCMTFCRVQDTARSGLLLTQRLNTGIIFCEARLFIAPCRWYSGYQVTALLVVDKLSARIQYHLRWHYWDCFHILSPGS